MKSLIVKKNDILFDLIHSLTKSEKRYFNIFCQRHTIGDNNNHMLLFKCISSMKEYDDSVLKNKLTLLNKPTKNLPTEKYNLRKLIMKSLKHFHEENSINAIILDSIIKIEILYEKGLYDLGAKTLKKTTEIAVKYDKTIYLSILSYWKVFFDVKLNNSYNIQQNIANAKKYLEIAHVELVNHISTFNLVNFGNINLFSQNNIELTSLKKSLKKENADVNSTSAQFYYYTSLGLIESHKKNLTESLSYFNRAISIFEDKPHLINEYINIFLTGSNNLLASLTELERFKEIQTRLTSFENIINKLNLSTQQKSRAELIIIDYNLIVIKSFDNLTESKINSFEENLFKVIPFINPNRIINVYLQIGIICFEKKLYRSANKYINAVISFNIEINDHLILIFVGYIIDLLILIETGKYILIQNTTYNIKKLIQKYQFGSSFLHLISYFESIISLKKNLELRQLFLDNYKKEKNFDLIESYFSFVQYIRKN